MKRRIYLIALFPLLLLTGCDKGFALVEAERRRIAGELKATLGADKDKIDLIVFDRPRTRVDHAEGGIQEARLRVERERIALLAAEDGLRIGKTAPAHGTALKAWRDRVAEAQQLVLIAEAAHVADDWLPTIPWLLDELLHREGIPGDRPSPQTRTLPPTESLRLDHAKAWFAAWQKRRKEATP